MPNAHVVERQRGTRPEHSPRAANGETIDPGILPDDDATDDAADTETVEAVKDNGVRVTFEAGELLSPGGARLLTPDVVGQRHGIVEQHRGTVIADEAGNITASTQTWRCQCGLKFQGKTANETEKLAHDHLSKFDPDVPRRR